LSATGSRSGFEVAVVDHTGIDLVAWNEKVGRLGITVKSRLRSRGEEKQSVTIFADGAKKDREKLGEACKSFGCEPWIGVYVEQDTFADLFLTSLSHYEKEYRGKQSGKVSNWSMGDKACKKYKQDRNVRHIHLEFKPTHGWWFDKGS
jgi:hypothetical protein